MIHLKIVLPNPEYSAFHMLSKALLSTVKITASIVVIIIQACSDV